MSGSRELSWYARRIQDSNQYCLYCGRNIGAESEIASNKEHWIGREFVPTGTLGGADAFNLIYRACVECNQRKAILERHLSSITLFNSRARSEDPKANECAARKGEHDFHPEKKGIRIKDSHERLNFAGGDDSFRMSFSTIAPPQPNEEYVRALAFMQLQGVFAYMSAPRPYRSDRLLLLSWQYFQFIGSWMEADWGNVIALHYMRLTASWTCLAKVYTAEGYFRLIIRENTIDKVWFFAFEWNKSMRVMGLICDEVKAKSYAEGVPPESWKLLHEEGGHRIRIKSEIPLSESDDTLFKGVVNA